MYRPLVDLGVLSMGVLPKGVVLPKGGGAVQVGWCCPSGLVLSKGDCCTGGLLSMGWCCPVRRWCCPGRRWCCPWGGPLKGVALSERMVLSRGRCLSRSDIIILHVKRMTDKQVFAAGNKIIHYKKLAN